MATKNLKLNIVPVNVEGVNDEIVFTSVADDNDFLRIPRRYPFVDIANLSALRTAGYFRHAQVGGVTKVSSEMGGSETTETEGKLGFELPRTEKLILLVRRVGVTSTGTAEEIFTIKGSLEYGIPDYTKTWTADNTFTSGTKIYPVSLYDLGLRIGGVSGEDGVSIKVVDKTLQFALIARMG